MLYLYGKSGTTYLYIHLNNDLTERSEDSGGCKPDAVRRSERRERHRRASNRVERRPATPRGITTSTSRCIPTTAPT